VLSSNDSIKFRMRLMALVLIPVAILLLARLYYVQVVSHEELFIKARRQYTSVKVTSGKRGEIFDVSGNLLVSNAPCEHIKADPSLVANEQQRRKIAFFLSKKLGVPYKEINDRLERFRPMRDDKGKILYNPDGTEQMREMRDVPIARNVPIKLAAELREFVKLNRIKCIFFEEGYMRVYPKGRMLSNVLGFTSGTDAANTVAVLGLERFFNREMSSEQGKAVYERARDGRPLDYGNSSEVRSRDGANIFLTIDEPLQSIMEEELDAAFEKWKPKAIYAIIADPKTGNVLAISQRPTFDPNDRSSMDPEAWRTRIVEDGMEPGSIIKPFTIGGAMDAGMITPKTQFNCENGVWIYMGKPLRDTHPYGMMAVEDIIKTSSNIGTAKVAVEFGADNVYRTLRGFGFGQRTGLPFKTESIGIMPPVKNWDGLSITRFPIGYAILVSPVQMVRAYCALANDGKLPKLRLVDRIEFAEDGVVRQMPIDPPVQMFKNPETCAKLVDMMTRVTGEGGTAKKAAIPGYLVAGKTGTSRKFEKGKGYQAKYFASFCGFVPAKDPAFVMLVTVDEPKGGSYGGTVSAPVFRSIAERALKHLGIAPDPALLPENGKPGTATKMTDDDGSHAAAPRSAAPSTAPGATARPASVRPAPAAARPAATPRPAARPAPARNNTEFPQFPQN